VAEQIDLPDDGAGTRWDDQIVAIVLATDRAFGRLRGVAAQVLPFRRPWRAVDRIAGQDADDLRATPHLIVGGWLLGQRPARPEGLVTRALPERSVRWVLAGAACALDLPSGRGQAGASVG
jgi:hypothetical protein